MELLLPGIAIALGLVLVLLAIPIDVGFNIEHIDKLHGHVNLHWFFGLARFRIAIPASAETAKPKGRPVTTKAAKRHKRRKGSAGIFAVLKRPAFRRHLYRFIKRLSRAAHAHNLRLRLRIGLGDPADTGQLWALLGPVSAMAANLRQADVHIEPAFIEAAFEFQGQGEFRLICGQIFAAPRCGSSSR